MKLAAEPKCFVCKRKIGEPACGWVTVCQIWSDDTNERCEAHMHKKCADKILPKELMESIWLD